MTTKETPVIVEEIFQVPTNKIWEAITSIYKMKLWYFDNIPDFKPVVGFKTEFNVKSEDRNFLHQWEITEVIPLKKITYKWHFKDYQGDALVHFEIFSTKKETILRVTNEVISNFSNDIPEFKRESCLEGWNYFIKDRFKNYIEKTTK
ncbi:MAG: SRPBCC domain-containing protein [Lutibacter sp.]|uniref:SRPBCC family protein n=1 Tax=Lutibacter sp. TaxID=1925666 RepID=UPI00385F47F5